MPDDAERLAITRRRFCQTAGIAACAAAAGGGTVVAADFLRPRVLFEPSRRFTAGPPRAFDPGEVITNEVERAYVIRQAVGFHAMSSVCTHLGCITRYRPDEGIIACPCHGSRFDLDGAVLAGPAPRPLHWLQMELSRQGEIVVDAAVEVPRGTTFRL